MQRYKLKEFDAAAEQFLPEEGRPLPSRVYSIGEDCWRLRTQEKWSEWGTPVQSQMIQSGDWIVRTNRGQIYRMSNEDFHNSFEK